MHQRFQQCGLRVQVAAEVELGMAFVRVLECDLRMGFEPFRQARVRLREGQMQQPVLVRLMRGFQRAVLQNPAVAQRQHVGGILVELGEDV